MDAKAWVKRMTYCSVLQRDVNFRLVAGDNYNVCAFGREQSCQTPSQTLRSASNHHGLPDIN